MRSLSLLGALSALALTACSALTEPQPILISAELIPSHQAAAAAAAAPVVPAAAAQPPADDPPPQGG